MFLKDQETKAMCYENQNIQRQRKCVNEGHASSSRGLGGGKFLLHDFCEDMVVIVLVFAL